MYCPNCGQEIDDKAVVCPKCGVPVSGKKATNPNDASSFGWAFLGFLVPIVGLILFLVWKDESPLKAKSCGKGALVSVIVSAAIGIIYACIVACAISSIASQYVLLAL